jgi:hypothetical protein
MPEYEEPVAVLMTRYLRETRDPGGRLLAREQIAFWERFVAWTAENVPTRLYDVRVAADWACEEWRNMGLRN